MTGNYIHSTPIRHLTYKERVLEATFYRKSKDLPKNVWKLLESWISISVEYVSTAAITLPLDALLAQVSARVFKLDSSLEMTLQYQQKYLLGPIWKP